MWRDCVEGRVVDDDWQNARTDPRDHDELAEAPREVPRYSDGVAARK